MKFKKGDRIIFIRKNYGDGPSVPAEKKGKPHEYYLKKGTVRGIGVSMKFPYDIDFDCGAGVLCKESSLELIHIYKIKKIKEILD